MAVRLECAVNNYHWGKIGSESAVAKLAQNNREEFTIEEGQTYAELWMGTLPAGPSFVMPQRIKLSEYIEKSPAMLGGTISREFSKLPFLFKVLSVNMSLSIQAHPNKKHAEELNRKYPDIYKDDNHKPEMAIALTEFEGMCGFRPFSEIQHFVCGVSELSDVLGSAISGEMDQIDPNDTSSVTSAIKKAFSTLMRSDSNLISQKVRQLVTRLRTQSKDDVIDDVTSELVQRLDSQFPGDVGIFSVFFLNHMKLKPGEAMFLGANLPHAYLSGDCMECMATSDNVVRAGLTPKFKDVETLVDMLDYTPKTPEQNLMKSRDRTGDNKVRVFQPDIPDFAVIEIKLPAAEAYTVSEEDSASILITISGEGKTNDLGQLKSGHIIFIPANASLSIEPNSDMLLYRALCLPPFN